MFDARSLVSGLVDNLGSDLLDEDGRPLGEVSSPRYDDVQTEVVPCPYADRRKGQPMNRSAMRQVSLVWPELLATFCALAGPHPTVGRIWQVSLIGIAAPLVSDTPIPRALSALYKTSLGLSQVTGTLLLGGEGVAELPFSALGDSGDFFAALDDNRWLFGQLQVCAGSRPMFEQLYEALCGRGTAGVDPLQLPDPEQIAAVASRTVAAHAAALTLADQLRGRGERIEMPKLPPWLRAVHAEPQRPPAHVRRYFPAGALPPEVEALLGADPGTASALDRAFSQALDAIAAL